MPSAKLPTAAPKDLSPLAWAILAASKDEKARTTGLTVHIAENGGRIVVATDLHRFHMAAVPDMTPLPAGVYRPPGWDSPDWHPVGDAWEVDWRAVREATSSWPRLAAGHCQRVDQLFGHCRAAIAYGQSTEWDVPLVWLRGRAFSARTVADAISGGFGTITGADVEVAESEGGAHLLRVRHVCGDAVVMGVGPDVVKAARTLTRPEFSGDQDVRWEGPTAEAERQRRRRPKAEPAEVADAVPALEEGKPRLTMLSLEAGEEPPFTAEGDEPELPGAEWGGDPEAEA